MGRKARIPSESLPELRRRLASLPARSPERRSEAARAWPARNTAVFMERMQRAPCGFCSVPRRPRQIPPCRAMIYPDNGPVARSLMFRTVQEAHETLYHFHKPETEAEANAWPANFVSRYNDKPHRRERHNR